MSARAQVGKAHASGPAQRPLLPSMRSPGADLLSNGIAVLARLASGTVLFVAMGRLMGPAAFGDFMSAMALATLVAFVSNLGLAQQALREVAAHPQRAAEIAAGLACVKLNLGLAVVASALVPALIFGGAWWLGALLTLALVADGAVEFLFALLKGHGRFGLEAGFSTMAALLHFAVVGAVCWWMPEPLAIAAAFVGSRALQLAAAVVLCGREMQLPRFGLASVAQWQQLRAGWAYAVDGGLAQLAAQLDTLLVRMLLGAHAAGVYQAGMRIVVGVLSLSMVTGNVFIPRLSRTLADAGAHSLVVRQLRRTYLALAALSGALVWGLGWLLMRHGYGPAFYELAALWPWFALLIVVRVVAANYGVQLTALGKQASRSVVNLVALVTTVLLVFGAVAAGFGLPGVLAALVASSAGVLLSYRHRLVNLKRFA